MQLRQAVVRLLRGGACALALVLLAAALLPGASAFAQEKKVSLAFTGELLNRIATASGSEQNAEIVDRILGLSPELVNARIQRASGRVSLFLTTRADDEVPVDFQFTVDKMAYYRMRTAAADAVAMTEALQEAKTFEPLLREVSFRQHGTYAVVDCTIDLGPALAAAGKARERREAEARAVAEQRTAAAAKEAEETRATSALRAAAAAKAAAKGTARSAPAPAAEAAPAPAAGNPPPPVQQAGVFAAKALGRDAEPLIDGLFSDAAWLGAERFTFEVAGASGTLEVSAWALWSPERVWIMLRWPDRSPDNEEHPWVWSRDQKGYVAGGEVEDALALGFSREGRLGECMLSGREAVSDLWTWRAGRTNPSGYAEDATLTVKARSFPGASSQRTRSGAVVWMKEDPDAGTWPWEAQPAGAFAGERRPGYVTRAPSGSAGDVAAKGAWRDGHWLVEFSRRLSTGDPADAVLTPGRDAYLSVAVFNAREGADHSTSREIVLRLQ